MQTPDYARAVLRGGLPNGGEEELTRRVELRLRRQNLLEREDAPTLWVVMEEAVLHRAVGSPDVMREQVERLLEFSELPHVSIDIVPFSAGAHSGACAPFTYFRFEEPELPDIVYSELLSAAVYFDQRADVVSHLEAHTRMALMTSSEDSTALFEPHAEGVLMTAHDGSIYNGMPAADLGEQGWERPWSRPNGGQCVETKQVSPTAVSPSGSRPIRPDRALI
ncbi:hypothetical protein SCALM49S_09207 [Streptomyces californicus]